VNTTLFSILRWPTSAEQAANYAYFFLAIGVLVQLEELLLEHYGWLEHKLDLAYLWRPAGEAFRRRWSVTVQAVVQFDTSGQCYRLQRQVHASGRVEITGALDGSGAAQFELQCSAGLSAQY